MHRSGQLGPAARLYQQVLVQQKENAEAQEHYRTALELQPDLPMAHVDLGGLHEEMGEMAEAEARFRAALRLQAAFALPHARLATLLRGKLPDEDLSALQTRLTDEKLGPGPRARLLFALAHALDARDDFARAADCLRQANALTLQMALGRREYVPAEHERFVDALLGAFDRDFFARLSGSGSESRRLRWSRRGRRRWRKGFRRRDLLRFGYFDDREFHDQWQLRAGRHRRFGRSWRFPRRGRRRGKRCEGRRLS